MKNKRFILLRAKEKGRNSSVAQSGEDYRLILLTQGQFAIVDAGDYYRLAQQKWCAGEFTYLNFPERIEPRNWMRVIIWAAWHKYTQDERAKRTNKKGRKHEAYGPLVRN